MSRPAVEVADIFREYGESYRGQLSSPMSAQQWRVMRSIQICRTAALGGHVEQCDHCDYQAISYNSCRNRHCPKCQSLEKARWIEARRAEILPVEYFHIIFTLPDFIARLALQNKQVVYNTLFRAASQALLTLGADPRHLGARIGFTAVLHTWGQNLMHHPHLHCVVPGGGLSANADRWVSCRKGFFLPVRALSRLYRRLFVEALAKAFAKGQLVFHGRLQALAQPPEFARLLDACRKNDWVVYAKPPFGGPQTVLDYLARYTHRIAISNHRLLRMVDGKVTFMLKNYRRHGRRDTLTLEAHEFIRRFLLHVLPSGFVRIRHYGFLANGHRAHNVRVCRQLLGVREATATDPIKEQHWAALLQSLTGSDLLTCPKCRRGRLERVQTLSPGLLSSALHTRAPPGIDSS